MPDKVRISLQDGTLVRHKNIGYQGRIDGITEIKACFTRGGAVLSTSLSKEPFQYRVVVDGQPMRHIAPADDLEILEQMLELVCFHCHTAFHTKPGVVDKAGGRCTCGGWICPACLVCRNTESGSPDAKVSPCLKERKRLVRKMAHDKKSKLVHSAH